MNSEENRNSRRDKKIERKKRGMRVDSSARNLAEIKRSKLTGINAFPPIKQAKDAKELRKHIEGVIGESERKGS